MVILVFISYVSHNKLRNSRLYSLSHNLNSRYLPNLPVTYAFDLGTDCIFKAMEDEIDKPKDNLDLIVLNEALKSSSTNRRSAELSGLRQRLEDSSM